MKKYKNEIVASILIVAFFFTGITNTTAQDDYENKKVEMGLRFMPTITLLDVQTSNGGRVKGSVVIGFGAGVLMGYNFTKNFGIQTEVIYSSISQKSNDANVDRNVNLRYINVPLLFSLNSGKSKLINLNLVVGPQISFNVGSSINMTGDNTGSNPQPILSVKPADFGFACGAGIDFALNRAHTIRLSVGYRGVFGLIDIGDKSKTISTDSYYLLDKSNVQTHSAYLGFSFLFG